jgi:glucose-6-phosphate 1-dehydrogenase
MKDLIRYTSPFVFVIFGATGDLAAHKLIPALYRMFVEGILPEQFFIVGFSRRDTTRDACANEWKSSIQDIDFSAWDGFVEHIAYVQGVFDEQEGYDRLIRLLASYDAMIGACIQRIFYLATPPQWYPSIIDMLEKTKLSEGCGQGSSAWTRIAIEKPFGKDSDTARMLDRRLGEVFEERQIFRVDHYLGKETVQNMLIFRFANSIFEPVWNNQFIDHIQISFLETKDLSGRGNFFDGVGILRDVAQNHLMQLVASVAMEQPVRFSKEGVRDARAQVIRAIRKTSPEDIDSHVVRGQYQGYLDEAGVDSRSQTETFVALKMFVDSPRMEHVPIYIRAGKALDENRVSVTVVFKQTCHLLFREIGCPEEGNQLTFHIQPDEGIELSVIAKQPGAKTTLTSTPLQFRYAQQYHTKSPDAYHTIIGDILTGDQMLFNRSDELEYSWDYITTIRKLWENTPLLIYPKGVNGPSGTDERIGLPGRWR